MHNPYLFATLIILLAANDLQIMAGIKLAQRFREI